MEKGNESFQGIFDAYQAPNLGKICRTNQEQSKVCKVSHTKSSNPEDKKGTICRQKSGWRKSVWEQLHTELLKKNRIFGVIGAKNREIGAGPGRPRAWPGLGSGGAGPARRKS